MKIGFAITTYNKFEEAKILFDIIRKEFKGDYPISFCSNHPSAKNFVKKEKPEIFTQGINYPLSPGPIPLPSKRRTLLIMRATDTIQKSCQGVLKLNVDYIIHMHSDAWVLNEKKLRTLIERIIEKKKKFAVRGLGFSWMGTDTPLGHVDDHFFVFDRKFAIEKKFFDFNVEEFWPHKLSIHGILAVNLISKIGLNNIWYYKNAEKLEYWDGKKLIIPGDHLKPAVYDPEYEMMHVHRASFPEEYGKKVQALYLKKAGFKNSEYIQNFIQKYYISESKLINDIQNEENKLNRKLKVQLYYLNRVNTRDFTKKREILKIGFCKLILKAIYGYIFLFFKRKILKKGKFDFLLYPVVYPQKISDYYFNILNTKNCPSRKNKWLEELEK